MVAARNILFVFGIGAALWFLSILWAREQVKKDLAGKGFRPVRIRWHPFAYWSPLQRCPFEVTFEDDTGAERKGRCEVYSDWNWRIRVRWIGDDVVYLQKKLPPAGRVVYVAIAGFLIQYGIRSLVKGESIYKVWRKNYSLPPISMRGSPAILLSLAALCGAWCLLSHVASHYDDGSRDRFYGLSARVSSILGWTLFCTSFLVYFYSQLKPNLFHN